jgi:hypothetical protein
MSLSNGLVAQYDFDSDLTDSVGSNDLTAYNGATVSDGKLVLTNKNSGVYPSSRIQIGEQFTYSLWFENLRDRSQALNGWMMFDGTGNGWDPTNAGVQNHYLAAVYTNDELGAHTPGGNWLSSGYSMTNVSHSGRHHLVVTCDNGTLIYYIDGQQVGNTIAYSSNVGEIQLFGSWSGYNYAPAESLDDIRVWSRTLSSAEVETLYDESVLLTDGMVAQYDLDGDASDSHGSFDGTVVGDAAFINGKHIQFAGDGVQHVSIPYSEELVPEDAITVSTWIKYTDGPLANQYDHFFMANGPATGGLPSHSWTISRIRGNEGALPSGYNNSGKFYFQIYDNSGNYPGVVDNIVSGDDPYSAGSVETERWYHIVGTFDGSSIKIYVDGQLAGTTSTLGNKIVRSPGSSITMNYYTAPGYPSVPGNAALSQDNSRIWNRALAAEEISNLFNETNPNNNGETPQGENNMTTRYTRSRINLETQMDDNDSGSTELGLRETRFLRRDGKSLIHDAVLPLHPVNLGQFDAVEQELSNFQAGKRVERIDVNDLLGGGLGVSIENFEAHLDAVMALGVAGSSWKAPVQDIHEFISLAMSEAWPNGTMAYNLRNSAIHTVSGAVAIESLAGLSATGWWQDIIDNGDGTFTIVSNSGADDLVFNTGDFVPFILDFGYQFWVDQAFSASKDELSAGVEELSARLTHQRTVSILPGDDGSSVPNAFIGAADLLAKLDADAEEAATKLEAILVEAGSSIVKVRALYDNVLGTNIDISDLAMGGRLEVYLDGLRLNFDVFGTDGGYQIGDGLVVIPDSLGHDTGAHITVIYDQQPEADISVGEG